jgi:hypothetical protein
MVSSLKKESQEATSSHRWILCSMLHYYCRKASTDIVFDVAADGHKTVAPTSTITFSSVVPVRMALTIAALIDLRIFVCDIKNALLTAPCHEKKYTVAGPEVGVIVVRALWAKRVLE